MARSGELITKPWRVGTNDENISIALRPLQCSNTGNPATEHHHAECKGVNSKESESYTFKFTRRVHKVCSKTASTHDIRNSIDMCNAYCFDDWFSILHCTWAGSQNFASPASFCCASVPICHHSLAYGVALRSAVRAQTPDKEMPDPAVYVLKQLNVPWADNETVNIRLGPDSVAGANPNSSTDWWWADAIRSVCA